MRPHVHCPMMSSLNDRQHPGRWTERPHGSREDFGELYEGIHDRLDGDAWLVGRVTMGEMSEVSAHPPASFDPPPRPLHVARRSTSHAVAIDRAGKLHFDKGDFGGDHVVILLGGGVADEHLAELVADGVSYFVSDGEEVDLEGALDVLGDRFGIRRLMLEGGGTANGSVLAAGLVDELSVLMCTALDGGIGAQGIVADGEAGLKGRVRLSLASAETLEHGVVHLRYLVSPATEGAER